jgi:hypothetical protein
VGRRVGEAEGRQPGGGAGAAARNRGRWFRSDLSPPGARSDERYRTPLAQMERWAMVCRGRHYTSRLTLFTHGVTILP